MLSPEVIATLNNKTSSQLSHIYATQSKFFIEKGQEKSASFFDWMTSKGTSIDCYVLYLNETNSNDLNDINHKLDVIRTIINSLLMPFQSQFFYWTLLLLIIHKFNFRKPIMKLVLYHYVFRVIGDIIDKLGGLLNFYISLDKNGGCVTTLSYTEQHPLKWTLTRQFNSFFWYIGEIIGDWYPLLRTRAVARDNRSIKLVYASCILYNLSKLSVPISQLFLFPWTLYKDGVYDKDHVDGYYNYYWVIQAVIILCSLIYDLTVYMILKNQLFDKSLAEFGFLKKFRTISEYRIVVSAIVGLIGLPFSLATAVAKVYFYNNDKKDLNFSIEDFRLVINNLQYMIIFIDQILLIHSKNVSAVENYNNSSSNNNYSSSNFNFSGGGSKHSMGHIKSFKNESKNYYSTLGNVNDNINFSSNNQNTLLNYTYSGIGNTNNSNITSFYQKRNDTNTTNDSYNENKKYWNYMSR